ncbi:MAG TPA: IS1634 family transposase [Terriglobia bacterium]|nr:IS1634 family transposase [Terriglobia bacterium]
MVPADVHLKVHRRRKDGKEHRYCSIVESRRVSRQRVVHRTVVYLGEINDSQQAAWRKTREVFDEQEQEFATLSLFPDDREIAPDVDALQVKLGGMQLERPRAFGACWLGGELWRQLKLDDFWQFKLPEGQEAVPWEKVWRLLVVNRLLEPGSEFRVHRQWFDQTARAELLGTECAVAEKDRLYRCLDRLLDHKQELFQPLRQRWQDLFATQFEVLFYDLTSTYCEGEAEEIAQAQRGYSRDHRPDCLPVVIALVITPEGFPLAYEGRDGNTSDRTTLRGFLDHIEKTYGRARRVGVMDRGIPTEALLAEMRDPERQMFYLVGTSKGRVNQHEKKWLDLPWQQVRESVPVKLYKHEGELYVLVKSEGRQAKENAIRRKRLVRLLRKLRAMRRSLPQRDQLLWRIGGAKKQAGRAFGFVQIRVPKAEEEVTRQTFTFATDKAKLRPAEQRDGHYLLRSNVSGEDPGVLWERYIQLTQMEAAFKTMKSELGLRPIYHQLGHRVEAPILVAFLAYGLLVTGKNRLQVWAPGLTPRAVLETLAPMQMLDVTFPTTDGRRLVMPRYTQPTPEQKLLRHQLPLTLPNQPPPRIQVQPEIFPPGMLHL